MGKLSAEFWQTVKPAYACINELVILPENGDCGFVEYFDDKAKKILVEKKIFATFDQQNKLMLEYPEAECKEPNVFEKFFESPNVVAQNHNFEGLFAIDISNYINKLEHDRFLSLISYIKSNPQTVYILFFYSESEKEIQRVYRTLQHHIEIIKTVLPQPTQKQLIDYTIAGLSALHTPLEDGVEAYFEKFYQENTVGYDTADYLIRHFKLEGFGGTLQEIETMMTNLDVLAATDGNYSGIGY